MQALFYEGDKNLSVGNSKPKELKQNEVQIKVSYCGICGTDLHIFHGNMDHRVTLPHVMGHEASGIIEKIGKNVSGISVGDRVVVMPLWPCSQCPACKEGLSHICHNLKFIGIETSGAFQEYWNVPDYSVFKIPDFLSLESASLIEPLAVACHDVRLSELKRGETAVILGAGPIGMLIAMVARQVGAEVILSEIAPYRISLARELGFDVVNPQKTDLVEYVMQRTDSKGADVVFEVTAHPAGAEMITKLPCCRGRIVVVGIFSSPPKVDLHKFFWRELKMFGARVYEKQDYLRAIELAGQNVLPIEKLITKVYPLEKTGEAFEFLDSDADAMKVLIRIAE